jgi:hypothetical protein
VKIALVPSVKPDTKVREKSNPTLMFTARSTETEHDTAVRLRNTRLGGESPCVDAEARIECVPPTSARFCTPPSTPPTVRVETEAFKGRKSAAPGNVVMLARPDVSSCREL